MGGAGFGMGHGPTSTFATTLIYLSSNALISTSMEELCLYAFNIEGDLAGMI